MNITVQRIYDYQTDAAGTETAVLVDRLYPRGVPKEKMAGVQWLKTLAPSAELRRWYHENPEQRFDAFAARYQEELQGSEQQQAAGRLKAWAQEGGVVLLTAVKNPERSHVSVLLDVLGAPFVRA
ncbi:MarR family transcriptional regulator [Neisseria dentiae]|uniref:MarR family transcriptional regulator n=1 Tax=Neisseria dentiae TaxID=194197 RepID=A0A1X3D5G9_9NEIS|nr:DUF488 family protein [Neisseria dentiae]OSI14992.1 MarR family transcriptional regulator [Neisseria dentiae]QMT44772.1 DUF488 family protein [Neisseria dentiae]STZ50495.1 Uncharacterized conserved protein [Neisseria dentiae]